MHRSTPTTRPATVTHPPDAHDPSSKPHRPRRRARLLLDRALSASAGIVALTALVVSIYQAWIAREQQKMSAWPYVSQDNTDQDGYAYRIHNVGLGPALVRSLRIDVDGRPVTDWGGLLVAALRVDSATLTKQLRGAGFVMSSVRRGSVLLPGSTTAIVRVADPQAGRTLRGILNDPRVHIQVCYCSLYRDCWLSDSQREEPTETSACPAADAARDFQS